MVQSLQRSHPSRIAFDAPELLEVQRSGFYDFLKNGIPEELSKMGSLKIENGNTSIELIVEGKDFALVYPEDDPRSCILKMRTYSSKLYVEAKIACKTMSGKILYQTKPEWVLIGHLPIMTKRGHFIINGSPRVIVHQVVRSPGIYFQEILDKTENKKTRFYGDIIPRKGVWVRLQMTQKGKIEVRLKKGKKVQADMLQKCLEIIEKQESEIDRLKAHPAPFSPIQPHSGRGEARRGNEYSRLALIEVYRSTLSQGGSSQGGGVGLQTLSRFHDQKNRSYFKFSGRKVSRFIFMPILSLKGNITISRTAVPSSPVLPLPVSTGEDWRGLQKFSQLQESKTRGELIAEEEAFSHTYDKLYRPAEDKEREEWERKQKGKAFRKRFSPDKGFKRKACYKNFFETFKSASRYDLSELGREKINTKLGIYVTERQLTALDINAASNWLQRLRRGEKGVDDIDHSQNRRVRTSGELLQTQFENGVERLRKVAWGKLKELRTFELLSDNLFHLRRQSFPNKTSNPINISTYRVKQEVYKGSKFVKPSLERTFVETTFDKRNKRFYQTEAHSASKSMVSVKEILSTKPINGALREFFGSNPLSQYMDQTNPLAELTHKRRISSLGIGGVSRESAGMAIRGIHPTHYGRICPIETPEGKNAGLVNSLAFYAKIDKKGFINTPYYRVVKGQVQQELGFSFYSAKEELMTGLHIAPSDLQQSWTDVFATTSVPVRVSDNLLDIFKKVNSNQVDCICISPIQMISVATSLIPFLEHNDANRALMGSNMQRQAVPLMIPERPLVGTGLESLVVAESGHLIQSQLTGFVSHVSADKIVVEALSCSSKLLCAEWLLRYNTQFTNYLQINKYTKGVLTLELPKQRSGYLKMNQRLVNQTEIKSNRKTVPVTPNKSLTNPYRIGQESEIDRLKAHSAPFSPIQPHSGRGGARRGDEFITVEGQSEGLAVSLPRSLRDRGSETAISSENERKSDQRYWIPSLSQNLSKLGSYKKRYCFKPILLNNNKYTPIVGIESRDPKQVLQKQLSPLGRKRGTCLAPRFHVEKRFGCLLQSKNKINCTTFTVKTRRNKTIRSTNFTAHSVQRLVDQHSVQSTCADQTTSRLTSMNQMLSLGADTEVFAQKLLPLPHVVKSFDRSNQDTCLTQRALVDEGDWVQQGDILTDCSASEKGELAVGKNIFIAYLPWEGYNFEDAIVISDRLVREHIYTSLHIERYDFEAQDLKEEDEWFTNDLPGVPRNKVEHLDEFGLPKIGSFVKEGDILVGKIKYSNKKPSTPYERLLCDILGEKNFSARDASLYVPRGVQGRVIKHKVISFFEKEVDSKISTSLLNKRSDVYQEIDGQKRTTSLEKRRWPKMVHIFLGEKRPIQVGDKMSGRHGNKGVVATILPRQNMPYLADGTPIDMILNPLGVPSRMNVGQVFECLLGLAGTYLSQNFKMTAFDELYGVEASQSLVYLKLYQARLHSGQNWLFQVDFPGKSRLIDGRSGDCFDQWITVGRAYMLKLIHMVNEKIHARSTGPYALVTQQPLRGRSQKGGQRLGEMEVWALEGFGAAYTLQEILTKKSDDIVGRKEIAASILPRPVSALDMIDPFSRIEDNKLVLGQPEIFKVLVCELQALCLDVGVYSLTTESFQRSFLGTVN